MPDYLIRKLELRDRLSETEKRALRSLFGPPRAFGANEDIVQEGDRPTESTLVVEGFSCRQTVLSDGERQITSIQVPGDFVDLHGFLIKKMDHSVTTLTACTVRGAPHALLKRLSEEHPHLTRLLWLTTLIDAAIHRRWLTAMGRQSALEQVAHLVCELYLRQKEVLPIMDATFRVPLTQTKLADALGISAVHTNRVIRELRETGFVDWEGEAVRIRDWEGLTRLADFDPTYLSLRNEPR